MKRFGFTILVVLNGLMSVAQDVNVDSLEVRVSLASGTDKINLLNKLSKAYASSSTKNAINFGKQALELSVLAGDKLLEAESNCSIGYAYYYSNQFDSSLVYYSRGMKTFSDMNDSMRLAEVYNGIGQVYYYAGQYDSATVNYIRSLRLSEPRQDHKNAGETRNYLGQIYKAQGQNDEALDNYQQALSMRKSIHDRYGEAQTLNGIGNTYYAMQMFHEALNYYKEALAIMKELGLKASIAAVTGNIGAIYGELNQYDQAIFYFNEALEVQKEIADSAGIANTMGNIGLAYLHTNEREKARQFLEGSMHIASRTGNRQLLAIIYRDLAITYAELDEFEDGYVYFRKYAELRDTLLEESSGMRIAEMTEKYESEKKEQQILTMELEQEKKNELAAAENRRKNIIIFSAVVVLVIVVVFSALLYNRLNTIRKQKLIIEQQKQIVEEKNKDITDSINYAQRIQRTLLAGDNLLSRSIADYFVFYQPRDIVSGDFYWAAEKDDRFYLAVCDSTGHGVPGAFMSILNISFLNEAVIEKGIAAPNEVLNHVRKKLTENISQDGAQDGMDGILVCINKTDRTITYSAAYNAPVLIASKTEVLPTDKMPIGISDRDASFTNYSMTYRNGDLLYLYTDGFADQFGGPQGKKYKYKKLNELLALGSKKSLNQQYETLRDEFMNWKGDLEQVDDVCIVGIRLE